MNRAFAFVPGFAMCAVLAGCGPSGVDVDGKVVNGNAPYTLKEGESINITLRGDDGSTGTATVEQDGTFKAKASSGGQVKTGKYKVSITHYPPAAAVAAAAKDQPAGGSGGSGAKGTPPGTGPQGPGSKAGSGGPGGSGGSGGSKGGPPMPTTKDAGEIWEVSATSKTFTLDMAKYK